MNLPPHFRLAQPLRLQACTILALSVFIPHRWDAITGVSEVQFLLNCVHILASSWILMNSRKGQCVYEQILKYFVTFPYTTNTFLLL